MVPTEFNPILGIIGGSGLYDIDGLTDVRWERMPTSFGDASDEVCFGVLGGQQLVFLPRHGRGHRVPPSEINYRANIEALKRAGVTDIISISAVGSLREGLAPGTFVIVDQFIDRTFAREKSFFGSGLVAHVSFGRPVCARIGGLLESAAQAIDVPVVRGGTYVVIEGPQFSTQAESELYRSWGCDVIGMTNMPEAKLAREAEMCYATVAMVTDYDCWHPDHDHVSVEGVLKVMHENADHAKALIKEAAPNVREHLGDSPRDSHMALDNAIVTAPEVRDPEMVKRLQAIAGRVLGRCAE